MFDLQKRYDLFINDGNFRDDTIYYAIPFIENLNIQKILEKLLFSKGGERRGRKYLRLIKTEFKVDSIDLMINRIKEKYIESIKILLKETSGILIVLNMENHLIKLRLLNYQNL